MIVRPAALEDAELIFGWWTCQRLPLSDAARKDARTWWKSIDEDAATRLLVAEHLKQKVGSILVEVTLEIRWVVAPEHRGRGLAKKMVGLVAEPEHIALIESSDAASQIIAARAGFDLIDDGLIQLWRACRAEPYL